jgi:hypothetical protein
MSTRSYTVDTGTVRTTVYFTVADAADAHLAAGQLLVTAFIGGAPPGVRLRLVGGDCATPNSPTVVWAQGIADATGTAYLSGVPATLASGDQYFLTVDPWPIGGGPSQRLIPGLERVFVLGQALPFVGHVNRVPVGGETGCVIGP